MKAFTLDAAGADYRTRREALRQAEIELKEQHERVAEMRRALPTETPVPEDYAFTEAGADGSRKVHLSELFAPANEALIVCHFMWGEGDGAACPMCTMWHDGYNAIQGHLGRSVPAVVVAKQAAERLRDFADSRGWRALRMLSSGGTGFNRDFAMEDADGNQMPGLSVFLKSGDGPVRHFYTVSAIFGDDQYRGMDSFTPLWNLLDLLPAGRGGWMPGLAYD